MELIAANVVWRWEYGEYIPHCPYCDEPAYEFDHCCFCGRRYQWIDGEITSTTVTKGEYTVVQATNNHITIYKNGHMVSHAQFDKKLSEPELLERIELHEKLMCMLEGKEIT